MTRRFFAAAFILASVAAPAFAADAIFNPAVLHEIRVVMDPSDWKALIANFRSNQYYGANASIDGDVIEQIGIRSAGQGSRSDTKPYLKLDFNKFVKGQKFHGLKSVKVKNLVQDQSMLRDYLAMSVFEAMGLNAPAYAFTRLTVNDEYFGIYNLVEAIEEPFLNSRFGEDKGNLYKFEYPGSPYFFTIKGGDPSNYIPDPFKPETDATSLTDADLVSLIRGANEATDVVAEVSKYLDVTRLLTYLGTENALAESDGFLGTEGMNNFYIYKSGGKFLIFPWDKNTSFNSPSWPILRNVDTNVLARKLLAVPAQKQVYMDAVKRAATSFVNTGYLGPKLEAAYSLIRPQAIADSKKPYSNDAFELAVTGLRGIIGARQADVTSQVP